MEWGTLGDSSPKPPELGNYFESFQGLPPLDAEDEWMRGANRVLESVQNKFGS